MPGFENGRGRPPNGPPLKAQRGREVRFERKVNVSKRDVSLVRDGGWQKLRVIIQSTDVRYIQSETEKILEIIERGEW